MSDTFGRYRTWLAFVGFGLIAAFFLFTEHRAHVFGALPLLFLLACPLLHLFGHGGHGAHGGHGGHGGDDRGHQPPPANARRTDAHEHGAGATRDDWRS